MSDKLLKIKSKWGLIAKDIALMMLPDGLTEYTASDIAATYNLTDAEYDALLELPAFQLVLNNEQERIKQLGPAAGTRLRAEALATSLVEHLYSKAMSNDMDDKQSMELLKTLMRSAGTDAPPETIKAEQQNTSVNIAFNLPKLNNKKLAHLVGQPQVNVIDMSGD